MNTCNFCFSLLVNLQVSEPYKSTAFTFDPKILSLVLVVSAVDRHIYQLRETAGRHICLVKIVQMLMTFKKSTQTVAYLFLISVLANVRYNNLTGTPSSLPIQSEYAETQQLTGSVDSTLLLLLFTAAIILTSCDKR